MFKCNTDFPDIMQTIFPGGMIDSDILVVKNANIFICGVTKEIHSQNVPGNHSYHPLAG